MSCEFVNGEVHGFLVWLDAPGDCMPFFHLHPAHNVRLFQLAFCLPSIQPSAGTLLCISNCSKPAMVKKDIRLLQLRVSPSTPYV